MKPRNTLQNKLALPLLSTLSRRPLVHFLHVAKTGGTAVRSALGLSRRKTFAITPSHILLFHDHSFRLRDVPDGHKIVFGVRNSVERFVSAYYSRQRHGKRGTTRWKEEEEVAFDHFRTPNELARALSSEDGNLRELAATAMRSIVHVRYGLDYWLTDVAALRARASDILYIYRQETLAPDFESIKTVLALPPSSQLPTDPILAHRMPPGFDPHLDPIARQNISAWYRADGPLIAVCEAIRTAGAIGDGSQGGPLAPLTKPLPPANIA